MKKRTFYKDITGQKFGKLTVLYPMPDVLSSNRGKIWMCRCVCGVEKQVSKEHLRTGTKSCGCSRYASQRVPKLETAQQAQINYVYNFYKYAAAKRKLPFDISAVEFYTLTQQPCHYCGAPPSNISKPKENKSGEIFIYNGVDRIDSAGGYTMTNCVPCCTKCNVAKSDHNYFDFLNWAEKIVAHRARYYKEILGA